MFDNYGRIITFDDKQNEKTSAVLSPILSQLIDFETSRRVGFLVYKKTQAGLRVPALNRFHKEENLPHIVSDSTFSYGNNETYRVLTDIKGENI